jgi:hypothetical protein
MLLVALLLPLFLHHKGRTRDGGYGKLYSALTQYHVDHGAWPTSMEMLLAHGSIDPEYRITYYCDYHPNWMHPPERQSLTRDELQLREVDEEGTAIFIWRTEGEAEARRERVLTVGLPNDQ